MARKALTPQQIADAKRLKTIWDRKKTSLSLTQEKVCEYMGWSSQGSVSQYLNGKIALNLSAVVKLAKILEVTPAEISPTLMRDLGGPGGFAIAETPGDCAVTPSTRTLEQLRWLVERGQLTDDDMTLLGEMAQRMKRERKR
jgi:transcriptional regulator with XRE-family HTH domain